MLEAHDYSFGSICSLGEQPMSEALASQSFICRGGLSPRAARSQGTFTESSTESSALRCEASEQPEKKLWRPLRVSN
eukprot:13621253-Alexandrium_andersonii.AAC.1